jgi:transcriptional regulator with XRE-family HTH domain
MKKSIWDDAYIRLREELKNIRLQADLTQIELSEVLGKPQSYVSKYEIGDRNLDFIEVINVCKACNINPEDFVAKFISLNTDKR